MRITSDRVTVDVPDRIFVDDTDPHDGLGGRSPSSAGLLHAVDDHAASTVHHGGDIHRQPALLSLRLGIAGGQRNAVLRRRAVSRIAYRWGKQVRFELTPWSSFAEGADVRTRAVTCAQMFVTEQTVSKPSNNIEASKATWLGLAVVVDALTDHRTRRQLGVRLLVNERQL